MDVERDAVLGNETTPGRYSNGDAWRARRGSGRASRSTTDSDTSNEDTLEDLQLSAKERIRHFTWTWFTMTMATGGIASVIATVPLRFHGLYAIGCIFFIFNLVLFVFNTIMMSLRYYFYPSTVKASLLHPTESLFVPASVISIGLILITIIQYGITGGKTGQWLTTTMIVFFWIYCALSVIFSCGIYLLMWSTQTFTISEMTPTWIFPAYPLLIAAPLAGTLCRHVPANTSLQIIIAGFIIQGIGFMVSLMIYAAYLYRLMTEKLPSESSRPGMFISVGPSGFTISGVISIAAYLPRVIPSAFMGGNGQLAGQVSMIMANWLGLWLWGLALWFFFVSTGAHFLAFSARRMNFAMNWYSFVFPNSALVNATFAIASPTALNNRPIQIIGCVMACILILVWFVVFGLMIRAVWRKDVLWPQKQEDRDEGGWSSKKQRRGKGNAQRYGRNGDMRVSTNNPQEIDERRRRRTAAKKTGPGEKNIGHDGDTLRGRGIWSSDSREPVEDAERIKTAQQRDAQRPASEGRPRQLHHEPEHENMMPKLNTDTHNGHDSSTTRGGVLMSPPMESNGRSPRPSWDILDASHRGTSGLSWHEQAGHKKRG